MHQTKRASVLAFALLGSIATCLLAQTPDAAPQGEIVQQEEIAVQAWGATHADCDEWSDACVVCRRMPETPACSMPGIACTPQATTCRVSKP